MRFPIYSLLFSTYVATSVVAAHSSTTNSHARRSLTKNNDLPRRQLNLGGLTGALGDIVDDLNGNKGDDDNNQGSGGNDPSTTPSDSTTASEATSTSASESTSVSSAEPEPTPSTTSKAGGLGPILGPVTSLLHDGVSAITSILEPTSFTPTSATESATDTTPPTTSSDTSSSVTAAPTSSEGGGGIIGGIGSGLSSIVSGITSILDPTPTPTSDPITTPTSDPGTTAPVPTSTTSDGGILPTLSGILSSILDPNPTSEPVTAPTSDPVPTSTSGGGIIPTLSSIMSSITSILDPPSTSDPVTPPTSDPGSTSDGPTEGPTSQPTSDISTGPPTSVPTPEPPVTDPPTSIPTSVPTSIPTSVIISFPTSADISTTEISGSETITDVPPTPSTTISINSDLSFILTENSLAFESISSTSTEHTLTDPDQATTTVDNQPLAAATTLSVAPLPTGIPGRIYPKVQLDTSQDMSGYTIISILFNQELNWPFVVQNQVSSSQIFAYLPVIISTALNIPVTDIKTWALQVHVPSSYKSPADSIQLGTMWLGYIPSDQVDILATEIKTKQSAFYTGVPDRVATALASHVNSGFNINSVVDPNSANDEPGAEGSSASSDNGKSRQDAIIGVVSALGAIALLVLVFLVYRSMKRRQELAHRRLSDPPDAGAFVIGARPEGREFDQDSVGGARRRSFYYAEDSLRGFQGERNDENHYDNRTSPTMSQRRNVVPATISAPILQQSSMNW